MDLGAFSISLNVSDLGASKAFYRKLGFAEMGDSGSDRFAILKNGEHVIGLFEGFIERNTLTFNPGWAQDATPLDSFTDIRDLQRELKSEGVELSVEADETSVGPTHFVVIDPDGNPVLVDQHV